MARKNRKLLYLVGWSVKARRVELAIQVKRFVAAQPGTIWALGWDTLSQPSSSGLCFSRESFGHLGFTGTSIWIDPIRELEVIFLFNRVHFSRDNPAIKSFRPQLL